MVHVAGFRPCADVRRHYHRGAMATDPLLVLTWQVRDHVASGGILLVIDEAALVVDVNWLDGHVACAGPRGLRRHSIGDRRGRTGG